jgi:hypothetical protein
VSKYDFSVTQGSCDVCVYMCAEKWLSKYVLRRIRNCKTLHLHYLCMILWNCLERLLCAERRFELALTNYDCGVADVFFLCYSVMKVITAVKEI